MFYFNMPHTKSLFILILLLFPITKVFSDELSQQVDRLQAQVNEANEKIAALTIDHHEIALKINTMQDNFGAAHQNIDSATFKNNPLETTRTSTRNANGHGR